jgi:hypothetical protein
MLIILWPKESYHLGGILSRGSRLGGFDYITCIPNPRVIEHYHNTKTHA